MGTVHEAVQEKPRRNVAVKIMRAGISSRADVATSNAEQQQRELAEESAGGLQQVPGFHSDMLSQIDPAQAGEELGNDVLVRFDEARERIDRTILEPVVNPGPAW